MESQNPTSLIIPVAEAVCVQPFRVKHLHRPGVTMPPHITVRSPFKVVEDITPQVLRTLATLFRAYPPFDFMLGCTARFRDTGVLYLAPEPVTSFQALARAIDTQFPDLPVEHPHPVFHLTLAGKHPTGLDTIAEEFDHEYGSQLPITARATQVHLYELRTNIWVKHTSFMLGHGQ
ncbi:MAG: 2'-5' RNA ligase family protein [Chloroflexota bacterium]|nr:2'-5' RNA ligase family protein [Chloroflexota bacterium]